MMTKLRLTGLTLPELEALLYIEHHPFHGVIAQACDLLEENERLNGEVFKLEGDKEDLELRAEQCGDIIVGMQETVDEAIKELRQISEKLAGY